MPVINRVACFDPAAQCAVIFRLFLFVSICVDLGDMSKYVAVVAAGDCDSGCGDVLGLFSVAAYLAIVADCCGGNVG